MSRLISWTGWTKDDWKVFLKYLGIAIVSFILLFFTAMIGIFVTSDFGVIGLMVYLVSIGAII